MGRVRKSVPATRSDSRIARDGSAIGIGQKPRGPGSPDGAWSTNLVRAISPKVKDGSMRSARMNRAREGLAGIAISGASLPCAKT
jgi:hypothetical protein